MKQRHVRIAELPFSFVGLKATTGELNRLLNAIQQNNDHIMSELRKLARILTDTNKAVDELTAIVDSLPEDDDD